MLFLAKYSRTILTSNKIFLKLGVITDVSKQFDIVEILKDNKFIYFLNQKINRQTALDISSTWWELNS